MVIAAATATAMQVRENLVGAMDCLLALSNGTGSGRLTLECGVRAEGRGQSPKLTNRERRLAGVGGGGVGEAYGRGRGENERWAGSPAHRKQSLQPSREDGGSTDVLGCREGSGCNFGGLRCKTRKTTQKVAGWFKPGSRLLIDAVGCRPNGVCNWREARAVMEL